MSKKLSTPKKVRRYTLKVDDVEVTEKPFKNLKKARDYAVQFFGKGFNIELRNRNGVSLSL